MLADRIGPASMRFMGAPQTGPFWDRWLSAYYGDRVVVTVRCSGSSPGRTSCARVPRPSPAARFHRSSPRLRPPRSGDRAARRTQRAARRASALPHVLLAFRGGDGFPLVAPVRVGAPSRLGFALSGPLPARGRRAGLLAHRFEPKLIGLETRQYTGWLQDGVYAPHTERGFRAPANKTLVLLANGFMARRGLRQARAQGRV